MVPRQHDDGPRPRLAEAGLRALGNQPFRRAPTLAHQVRRRIHRDGDEVWIVVGLAMQEQHARLGSDRNAHLVGDLETATSLEALLGKEDLDMPHELLAILEREARYHGHVLLHERSPFEREQVQARRRPPPTLEPCEDHRSQTATIRAGPLEEVVVTWNSPGHAATSAEASKSTV